MFNWGHSLHNKEPCIINNKECKICFLENEKLTIGTINPKKKNILISNEENNIKQEDKVVENKNKIKEDKNIKYLYDKIDNIDETFRNRKSLIEKDISYKKIKFWF